MKFIQCTCTPLSYNIIAKWAAKSTLRKVPLHSLLPDSYKLYMQHVWLWWSGSALIARFDQRQQDVPWSQPKIRLFHDPIVRHTLSCRCSYMWAGRVHPYTDCCPHPPPFYMQERVQGHTLSCPRIYGPEKVYPNILCSTLFAVPIMGRKERTAFFAA